jgi:hypothetical protein
MTGAAVHALALHPAPRIRLAVLVLVPGFSLDVIVRQMFGLAAMSRFDPGLGSFSTIRHD